jgi:hypothetical protein
MGIPMACGNRSGRRQDIEIAQRRVNLRHRGVG